MPRLSIRALAARPGSASGCCCFYFADKHAVFAALMQDHQADLSRLLDDQPRAEGSARRRC